MTAIGITVTATTFGLGTGAVVAVSVSILAACTNMKANKGVIVSFSRRGTWGSTKAQ
ncbi:hypothetical protein [Oenococcus sicerae]|uniref:hypothetical protein n=1 Tax=Oenococcus sicerae TaxID=2203724 RepID=UPI0010B9FA4F|nr:hypothetical protein OAL24_00879 [Oenococcus sicerae]